MEFSVRGVLGSALCAWLCACGTEATPGPSAVARDSAGVTIVENQGAVASDGGGWSVTAEPSLVLGGLDGPEEDQLYRVRGALRLPDGRIAVGNDGTREVRVYGADGTHLTSVGREGEGPGEFKAVVLVGRLGDTLVVLDRRLGRISLIHPDQGFVRSFSLQPSVSPYPLGGWVFQTGSILIRDLPLESGVMESGFHRNPVPLRSCDMSGMLLTDFGAVPGAEQVTINRETPNGLATLLNSIPFGRSPQIAVAGDQMYLGTQDAFEIKVFGSDGALRRIVRLDRPVAPVTDADLEAYVDHELADISDENEARRRREELEGMPRAESRPAHGAIWADAQGYLFVEDFRAPGNATPVVSVFDPTGRLTGRFTLPAPLQVLEVGQDYLLGLYRDDMGVEYVRVYGLTRPG